MNKFVNTLKALMVLTMLMLLAGCPTASVQIVTPTQNAVSNQPPEFRLRFPNGVPATFTATLNGTALPSSSFTVSGNDAYLQTTANQLLPGNNNFTVTTPGFVTTKFYYDVVGPVVHLEGATGTSTKTVTGYLSDVGGPVDITINGIKSAVDSTGHFSLNVPAATTYNLVATDTFGNATTETYVSLGQTFNKSLGVRVNQKGLQGSVPDAILALIESTNFKGLLVNPIISQCINNPLLADACAGLSVNDLKLATGSTIDITALDGNQLAVSVYLSKMSLDLTASTWAVCHILTGCSLIPYVANGATYGKINISGVATVTNTSVTMKFALAINKGKINVNIVPGSLAVNLPANGLSVALDYGAVGKIPLVGNVFTTLMNNLISGLASPIASLVLNTFDKFLATPISLVFNNLITNIIPNQVGVNIADTTLYLGFIMNSFSTSTGGLDLDLSNSVTIANNDPTVQQPLGSRYVSGAAPATHPTTTPKGSAVDVTATISANLINQVLAEAYQGGVMHITLDQNNGLTIGSLLDLSNVNINLSGVTNLSVEINGGSAPEVSILPQANAATGVLFISVLDLNLVIKADLGDGNGVQQILSTTVDLRAPIKIGINSANALSLSIEKTPDFDIQQIQLGLGGMTFKVSNTSVVGQILNTLAPQILPPILSAIGAIPLPAIAGYNLQLVDVWNPNANNQGYMTVGANLVPAQ